MLNIIKLLAVVISVLCAICSVVVNIKMKAMMNTKEKSL